MYRLLSLILLSGLALGQAAPPASKPATPTTPKQAAPAAKTPEKAEVPETAAVITIEGVCNGKIPATPSPDCKTVITRAQFEKLANALDPNMPPFRRQQLADVYSRMIIFSDAADQRGIQNKPETEQVMRFTRMQTLTQLLLRDLQREATNVPPAETEKYYNEHQAQYEQATFQRIFIPKTPPGNEKPPDEKTLQAEGAKIRAAAAASGADFEKLQKQAYEELGIKTPPPPTNVGTQRREALPPSQQKVFELQPGQVSEVISEPGGLYIFKLESKKKLTLAEVTPEINRILEGERMKQLMDKVTKNIKPELNQGYFGAAAGPGPVVPPGGAPMTGHGGVPGETRPAPPMVAPPQAPPPATTPPKPPGQ